MSTLKTANLQNPSAGSPAIVLASDGTATAQLSSVNGGPLAGARNRIINGDMRIDQRNAGASVTVTGTAYAVDRMTSEGSVTSKFSVQQSTTVPSGAFTNSLLHTSLAATTVGASDYYMTTQYIEGFNVADLGWGTAAAQSVTISFWVRSSLTGTFGGCLNNQGNNRSYPFTYTISAANTWEYKTITVAGDTSGTWNTGNLRGICLRFGLGIGSTYSGAAGSWSGSTFFGATGATSVVGTNGATFYITGVQLEPGTVATPFERRSYGQELALCQRYFYMHCKGNAQSIGVGTAYNASLMSIYISMPVTMRINPSAYYSSGTNFYISYINGSSDTFNSPGNLVAGSPSNVTFDATDGVSVSAGSAGRVATNSSDAYIGLSAEL